MRTACSFSNRLNQNKPVPLAMLLHEVFYIDAKHPGGFLNRESPPLHPLSESQIERIANLPGFPAVSGRGRVKPVPPWWYSQTAPSLIVAAVKGTLPCTGNSSGKRRRVSKQWMDAIGEPSDLIPVALKEFIEQFFRPSHRVSRAALDRIAAMTGCPAFLTSNGFQIPIRKGLKWAYENGTAIQQMLNQETS